MNSDRFNPLVPELNMIPPNPISVYLMGVCGAGMASLAGILKYQGFSVMGSDVHVYPPMSDFLESLSIPVLKGYSPENLASTPDLVIVGNVITRENPEVIELSRLHIPYLSMPQALRHFAMKDKRSIVIAGTHGKTTTSSLVSWILEESGMAPSYMIGGILKNFQKNFRLGDGPFFVIEGDEYDTAFFDKGPKFLHYAPWVAILTSIEFDHADIFRDLDHIINSFRQFIDLIPPDGLLIANGDDPITLNESQRAKCSVITYGLKPEAQWRAVDISVKEGLTHLTVLNAGKEYARFTTSLYGDYNILNLLPVVALSRHLNISSPVVSQGLNTFQGVKRRQEILGEKKGIRVIDDFAHHPTAVEETIHAVKTRFMGHRLIAVFEPRSNSSRRNVFQERYARAFDHADLVMIPEPPMMDKIDPLERFSSVRLVNDLNTRGIQAVYSPNTDHLLKEILKQARRDDVILIMSNGSFDNVHRRLLEEL